LFNISLGAIMNLMSLLFSFTGRINRGKWWLAVLIFAIYGVVASIIGTILIGSAIADGDFNITTLLGTALIGILVLFVLYVIVLVSSIAVGVKRLHDRDKSGWWLLLFFLLPAVLGGIGQSMGDSPVGLLLGLVSLAIYIWMFVELACLRGTVGPNRFGPDPLEGSGVPASV
jgi:uncharacterized membrane protein YhaH (DUF805 family)